MAGANDSLSGWHLSLRVDRPIVGCELQPHAYLKLKSGANPQTDLNARGALDVNSHFFVYRWLIGPELPVCARDACPRRHSFSPVLWSRYARGGPSIQCVVCAKAGQPRHETIFCSLSCFRLSWKIHSEKHCKALMNGKPTIGDEEMELPVEAEEIEEDEQWMEISNARTYTPIAEDVGKCLKLECRALSLNGEVIAGPKFVCTEPVLEAPAPPPKRSLLTVAGAASSTGPPRFRVVSYNILAEVYATKHTYPYCDHWQLNWEYRKQMLLQELHDMSGDVLCLQEVQADHYEKELKPWLSDQGYDGLFKQKTRESMGQHGKVDGCAIFWKRSKFLLVENYTIEFNECARRSAASLHMDSEESHRFMQRLSRDNVAQLVVLELFQRTATRARHHGSQICVVNTHLYSNHQRPDVKIWQCLTLLREIEHFVVQRDLPLLICGDFNSEPDSAVYQLLADRCVMGNHPELDGHPISVLPEVHQISHNLDLASVYGTALGQEPLYTNYTGSFRGTLDYIWFTPAKLRVLTIAAIPEVDILETAGEALPNPQYPSDHLSMCCDVQLAASGPVVRPGTRKVPSLHASPASKAKHRR